MALQPFSVNLFGAFVCVGAVEQHDAARERAVGQHAEKVALSATRLGKDNRLLRSAELGRLSERDLQRRQKRASLGVVLDGRRCGHQSPVLFLGGQLRSRVLLPLT
jgi:hypothetical protein